MKRSFTSFLLTILLLCGSLSVTAQNSTCSAPSGPMPQPGDPPICYVGYTVENTGPLTQYYTFVATTPSMQVMLLPVVGTACSFPNTAITYSNLRLYAFGDCVAPIGFGALFFGLTPGDTYIWGCTMTPVDPVCVWIAEACPSVIPSPLPIGLSNFEAVAVNEKVRVNWNVATAGTYQHFTVQRSHSPDVGFEDAGIVTVEGSGQKEFQFEDQNPIAEGQLFYRLSIVQEGTQEFSEVVAVKTMAVQNWLSVYPNPSSGSSEILISGNQMVTFRITNMSGMMKTAANESELKNWMEAAPAGMYFIEGLRENEKQVFRWVKI